MKADLVSSLAAFDTLRAEDETWLAECYLPPREFSLMAGWRSALIYGDVGSGKTALRLALERVWVPDGEKPTVLLVHWPMTMAETAGLTGTALVQEHMGRLLDLVVRGLLLHLGRYPNDFVQAPDWVHDTIAWFTQKHLRGDLVHHITSLQDRLSIEGHALLRHICAVTVPEVVYPGTPAQLVITELIRALQTIGLAGIRTLVEGLEPWLQADPGRLARTLQDFLSALKLFEHPQFMYALFLPAELESSLWSAGSVGRRRVDTYRLAWDGPTLRAIIERRLGWALGDQGFTLGQLGPEAQLLRWLERCGGFLPRGWLESIRPFLAEYVRIENRKSGPLNAAQCLKIQEGHPPRLFMDTETAVVTVGWREVLDLQQGQKALLRFLYARRGRLCQRREVYRAYLEGTGRKLSEREFAKDYAGALDNAIFRLRQAVEPDPEHPVFVITVKGEGFRLDNAW